MKLKVFSKSTPSDEAEVVDKIYDIIKSNNGRPLFAYRNKDKGAVIGTGWKSDRRFQVMYFSPEVSSATYSKDKLGVTEFLTMINHRFKIDPEEVLNELMK